MTKKFDVILEKGQGDRVVLGNTRLPILVKTAAELTVDGLAPQNELSFNKASEAIMNIEKLTDEIEAGVYVNGVKNTLADLRLGTLAGQALGESSGAKLVFEPQKSLTERARLFFQNLGLPK